MQLSTVWLKDFRSYEELEVELHPGFTAILGPNGVGKTNLLEAISLLATLQSFRRAPTESLIRRGADRAIVRATGIRDDREVLVELELAKGRVRAQVNRQKLKRTRDLLGALRITLFAPDDLALVKDGPGIRRDFVDDLLVALDPQADAVRSDLDRIVKQRNALLRQSSGRLDDAAAMTLDIWDAKLVAVGEHLTVRRENLLHDLMPLVTAAYRKLSAEQTEVVATYLRSWSTESMAGAVAEARNNDVRRGVTTVGPHRDDIRLRLEDFDSRTEASQGEQRTLALALRLAGHQLVTDRLGEPPLLLLDDVLSELDPDRARALLDSLPPGQTVVTSASGLPEGTVPDQILVHSGVKLVRQDGSGSDERAALEDASPVGPQGDSR